MQYSTPDPKDDDDDGCDSTITSTNTGNGSHHSKRKRNGGRMVVLFDLESNKVFPIPRRESLTMEQALDIWYTGMEKHFMMEGALKAASGLHAQDTQARGLEYHTSSGFFRIQTNRDRAMAAVLKEQARQQQKGIKEENDELISEAYWRITKPCQEQATVQGRIDEAVANPQWHVRLPHATTEEYEYLNGNNTNIKRESAAFLFAKMEHLGVRGMTAEWMEGVGDSTNRLIGEVGGKTTGLMENPKTKAFLSSVTDMVPPKEKLPAWLGGVTKLWQKK
ncbi:expressed unknown protein [Seminavis robusta]|uniref:Uncharacterized protein n=1 Tax=Seminavis robusta TaxID=568900 RepID=A0A9N8EJ81_9STRA|nr:expressed unknown protein [Seminavis robusta]|eukprot:Sro1168_g248430.1 n/a (278) ;mRNA; f:2320-3153